MSVSILLSVSPSFHLSFISPSSSSHVPTFSPSISSYVPTYHNMSAPCLFILGIIAYFYIDVSCYMIFAMLLYAPLRSRAIRRLVPFWVRNLLRAAVTCTFSTSQWPEKITQAWDAFSFLTSNLLCVLAACSSWSLIPPDGCAPAALARLLFNPWGPQNIGKHTLFRDFSTFSRALIFFLLTLFSDSFSSHSFSPLTLLTTVGTSAHKSEVWLPNFLWRHQSYVFTVSASNDTKADSKGILFVDAPAAPVPQPPALLTEFCMCCFAA